MGMNKRESWRTVARREAAENFRKGVEVGAVEAVVMRRDSAVAFERALLRAILDEMPAAERAEAVGLIEAGAIVETGDVIRGALPWLTDEYGPRPSEN